MKKTENSIWKVLVVALAICAFGGVALAQSMTPQDAELERMVVGGGFDDDREPGVPMEAMEDMAPAVEEAAPMEQEAPRTDEGQMTELMPGVDLSVDELAARFFENPDRMEPLIYEQLYETAGYLDDSLGATGEVIDGQTSSQASFAFPDHVYINRGEAQGVSVGSRFIVYHAGSDVRHPVTRRKMGFKVLVDGVIEVVEAGRDHSKARIIRSYDGIERGEKIRAYDKAEIPEFDPDRPVKLKRIDGYLVSSKDPKEGYATGDVVYLDVGQATGVEPGDVFNIIDSRSVVRADGKMVEGFPKVIGEAKVISTRSATCTAFITNSVDAIYRGDKIAYSSVR